MQILSTIRCKYLGMVLSQMFHLDTSEIAMLVPVYSMSLTRMRLSDMEFLEVLIEGLDRVLLVRGGGREVITIYS